MATNLGAGERQVLTLALETADAICVLDDALARRVAIVLKLRITGTLGILIDAKRAGLIEAVRPQLDQLHSLGFRLAAHTRAAVLKMAGEIEGRRSVHEPTNLSDVFQFNVTGLFSEPLPDPPRFH